MNSERIEKMILFLCKKDSDVTGLKVILEEGYSIRIEQSIAGATAVIDSEPGIVLVIIDIALSENESGIEAAKRIRNFHDVPVMFRVADATEKQLRDSEPVLTYGYIDRGVSRSVLLAGINAAVRLHRNFLDVQVRNKMNYMSKTEEALRESEDFIKAVMDNLPIGIAVNSVDPTVNFEYMNDNFPRFYRTSAEQLQESDSFWDAVYEDPEYRQMMKKRVLEGCETNEPRKMQWNDVEIARKGSEPRYINAGNTPVPSKNLMISSVWDVTDRKRFQDSLVAALEEKRALFDELQHRVKNSFNTIMGIIDIISAGSCSDDTAKVLTEVNARIRSIAEVYSMHASELHR